MQTQSIASRPAAGDPSPAVSLVKFVTRNLPSVGKADLQGWEAEWDVEPCGTHAVVRISEPDGTELQLFGAAREIQRLTGIGTLVKDGAILLRVKLKEPLQAEEGWYMDTDEEGNPRAIKFAGAA